MALYNKMSLIEPFKMRCLDTDGHHKAAIKRFYASEVEHNHRNVCSP